jgi:hypothetical protein
MSHIFKPNDYVRVSEYWFSCISPDFNFNEQNDPSVGIVIDISSARFTDHPVYVRWITGWRIKYDHGSLISNFYGYDFLQLVDQDTAILSILASV